MSWIYLLIAAVFEIAFAASMKASEGFTRPWASTVTVIGIVGGIAFLTLALKQIPLSTGYSVWTGIGSIGTVVVGICLYGEGVNVFKLLSIAAILIGVIGLKTFGGTAA